MNVTRLEARHAAQRLAAAPAPLVDPGFVARLAQQLGDVDLDLVTIDLRVSAPARRERWSTAAAPRRRRPAIAPRPRWALAGLAGGLVMATVAGALALRTVDDTNKVRVNDPGTDVTVPATPSTVSAVSAVPATSIGVVTAASPASTVPPTTVALASEPTTAVSGDPGAGPTEPVPGVFDPAQPMTVPPAATAPLVDTTAAAVVAPVVPALTPVPTTAPTTPTTVAPTTEVTTASTMTITCLAKTATGVPVVICEWPAVPGAASYALLKGPSGRVLSPNPGFTRVEDRDVLAGSTYTYVVWARDGAGRNLAHSPLTTARCCGA